MIKKAGTNAQCHKHKNSPDQTLQFVLQLIHHREFTHYNCNR